MGGCPVSVGWLIHHPWALDQSIQCDRTGGKHQEKATRPSKVVPAAAAMAELKALRMQDLRENLERLHQPRPRTVEELIAVGRKDFAIANGPQFSPRWMRGDMNHLGL